MGNMAFHPPTLTQGMATALSCCAGCMHGPSTYTPAPMMNTAPSSTELAWTVKKTNQQKAPEDQIRMSPFGDGGKQQFTVPKHNPAGVADTQVPAVRCSRASSPLPLQTLGSAVAPCPFPVMRAPAWPAPLLLGPPPCWGTRGWGKPSPALWEVLAVQSKP